MGVSASEVEVPVHVVGARMGGVMAVLVAMSVEALGGDHPQCEQSQPNQQHPAETLAALLDDFGNLPSEHQDGRSAYEEQQRVAEREPHCDLEWPPKRDRLRTAAAVHRQGGNCHQMIGTEPMEEPQGERGQGKHAPS